MRALVLGVVAAIFAMAAPGLASADTGGHIKLTYASIDADNFYDYYDCECYYYQEQPDNTVALSGDVVTDINDTWRVQFNATTADTEVNYGYYYESGYSYSEANAQAEVHATMTAGNWDVGVFGGMFQASGTSGYEYGAEAAYNFPRGEVSLSVAGVTAPNEDYSDDLTTVAAAGSFNLTDNLTIGAGASHSNFGNWYYYGDSEDLTITSYSVHVAYAIPNSDFTVALAYRTSNLEYYDLDEDVDFFGVQVGWAFGEGANGRVMPGASALIPDSIAAISGYIL